MPKPAGGDWVAIGFALLGLPLIWVQRETGMIWVAQWLGTAIMLIASRLRLPRFEPRKPPMPAMQNLDSARMEGAPTPYGWWWMILPFTLALMLTPAALMVPEDGVLIFAIVSALMLCLWLGFALGHERGSAKILGRVLRAGRERRVIGVVRDLGGDFMRTVSWRSWSGTHHGTAQVTSVSGGTETVATVTHTTNTMGYREEVRHAFAVSSASTGAMFSVNVTSLIWAGEPRRIGEHEAPNLRKLGVVERSTLNYFTPVAMELEQISEGDRVVVLAPAEDVMHHRLRGTPSEPLVVYVTGAEGDPVQQLRRLRAVRWASVLGIAACIVVTVWVGV